MSNILRPWEIRPSDEVYVIDYNPSGCDDEKVDSQNSEEQIQSKNKEEYDATLEEFKKRQLAQERILLIREQEIMQKANLRADYIINTATTKAKTEGETILGEAMVEADKIRDNAFTMGYNEGFQKAEGELLECIEKLNASLNEVISNHEESLEEIKKDIDKISLTIAEKVLNKHIEVDETEMANLIEDLIYENKQSGWLKVQISDKMLNLIDYVETVLVKKYPQLSVEKVNQPVGTCLVDTPEGIIDASVKTQLDNIRQAITKK